MQTFELALGKFPIGTVGGFADFNINTAFIDFVNQTLAANNRKNSKLVEFLNNPNNFKASDYATFITINIPNQIIVYSNSDYQETYNTLSAFGAKNFE